MIKKWFQNLCGCTCTENTFLQFLRMSRTCFLIYKSYENHILSLHTIHILIFELAHWVLHFTLLLSYEGNCRNSRVSYGDSTNLRYEFKKHITLRSFITAVIRQQVHYKNILNHAEQTYRIFLGQVFRLKLFLLHKDAIYTQCTVSMCILCNLAVRILLFVVYISNVIYKFGSYITLINMITAFWKQC